MPRDNIILRCTECSNENYITTSYFKVKTNDERLHENYYDGDIVCYVSSHKHKDYRMFIDADEI